MSSTLRESETLDRLVGAWAQLIARSSGSTVRAIVTHAEYVRKALDSLSRHGRKARQLLARLTGLPRSMMSEPRTEHAGQAEQAEPAQSPMGEAGHGAGNIQHNPSDQADAGGKRDDDRGGEGEHDVGVVAEAFLAPVGPTAPETRPRAHEGWRLPPPLQTSHAMPDTPHCRDMDHDATDEALLRSDPSVEKSANPFTGKDRRSSGPERRPVFPAGG